MTSKSTGPSNTRHSTHGDLTVRRISSAISFPSVAETAALVVHQSWKVGHCKNNPLCHCDRLPVEGSPIELSPLECSASLT